MALVRAEELPAWPYKAAVGDACLPKRGVECRVCGDFCDVRAIRFAPRLGNCPLPAMNDHAAPPRLGACVGPCPTAAIRILGSIMTTKACRLAKFMIQLGQFEPIMLGFVNSHRII